MGLNHTRQMTMKYDIFIQIEIYAQRESGKQTALSANRMRLMKKDTGYSKTDFGDTFFAGFVPSQPAPNLFLNRASASLLKLQQQRTFKQSTSIPIRMRLIKVSTFEYLTPGYELSQSTACKLTSAHKTNSKKDSIKRRINPFQKKQPMHFVLSLASLPGLTRNRLIKQNVNTRPTRFMIQIHTMKLMLATSRVDSYWQTQKPSLYGSASGRSKM